MAAGGYGRRIGAMSHSAWTLIIVGVLIAVVGLVWIAGPSVPWLGQPPGDIVIERENSRLCFPITTCLLLSALSSAVMSLAR